MHHPQTSAPPYKSTLDVLPTGHPQLDMALGVGGLARGRFVEFQSSSPLANMSLALRAAAETQARGGVVALIDAQHTLDVALARSLGVRIEELLISQPDEPLMALEIARHVCRSGAVDLVIMESLGAMVSSAPPELPRPVPEALRGLWNSASRSRTCILFTTTPHAGIGDGMSTSLRYLSSVRCLVTRVGSHALVKVGKNQLAPAFTEADIELQPLP